MERVLSNREICDFETITIRNKNRDEIITLLEETVADLAPNDKILFYYAGHGKRLPRSGKLHLIAADTKLAALNGTAVPMETVLQVMHESRCQQRVLILDCCHSGAVGAEFRGGELSDCLGDLALSTGTCILTASTAIQTAEERESADIAAGSGHGVFTRYFIDGLEKGEAPTSSDGETITIDGVYDYVYNHLVLNSLQKPQRFLLDGTGAIEIGHSIAVKWDKRRSEVQNKFYQFLIENTISNEHLIDVLRLTGRKWSELVGIDRQASRKLLDVLDGRLSVAAFYAWLAAERKSDEETKASHGQENVQAGEQEPNRQPPRSERSREQNKTSGHTSRSVSADTPSDRPRGFFVRASIFFLKICVCLVGIYSIIMTPVAFNDRYRYDDSARVIFPVIASLAIIIVARRIYTWRAVRRKSV
jgi:hypothetical protein